MSVSTNFSGPHKPGLLTNCSHKLCVISVFLFPLQFACLCILFYCSSFRPSQGVPLKPRMKSSHSRNRHTNDAYSETLDDIILFPSIELALLDRKPRNINAILNKPTATRNGRLQSRSGNHFLKISRNGDVRGSSDVCSPYGMLNSVLFRSRGSDVGGTNLCFGSGSTA